jgi:hypothetical protein
LTAFAIVFKIAAGGSRKGSKGNVVRTQNSARNAAAAPATVSGESLVDYATGSGQRFWEGGQRR